MNQFILATELVAVAENLLRSTVKVQSGKWSVGSGVIWRSDGLIITNAHVVHIPEVVVELADGRTFDARCIRRDRRSDLAALQIAATDLPRIIAATQPMRVGELVLAAGNPHGEVSVTTGIITRIDAQQRWILADVQLASGNSGGALADVQGQIIGINSMIVQGMAVAIPSHTVKRFLQPRKSRSHLGVTIQPVRVPLENQRIGLLVLEVHPGSVAATAGLLIGDIVIGINGQLLRTAFDLTQVLQHAETLELNILRGGQSITCYVSFNSDATEVA